MNDLHVGQCVTLSERYRAYFHYPHGWTGTVIAIEPNMCLIKDSWDWNCYYPKEDLIPISDALTTETRAMTQFWVVEE